MSGVGEAQTAVQRAAEVIFHAAKIPFRSHEPALIAEALKTAGLLVDADTERLVKLGRAVDEDWPEIARIQLRPVGKRGRHYADDITDLIVKLTALVSRLDAIYREAGVTTTEGDET